MALAINIGIMATGLSLSNEVSRFVANSLRRDRGGEGRGELLQ